MIQGPDYIFCLQDKDFKFWRITNTGSVTKSSSPYFLEFAPAGWEDIAIQNIRNRRYWGTDRSVSIPLAYVNDGAKIIKYIFYTLGIEEPVYLVIAGQRLDYNPGVDYGYWYKQLYRGEVDISTFSHAGARITCATLEDGLPKFLKANENTTYEIPLNVNDAIKVKMDGINLHERINYADTSGFDIHLNEWNTQFRLPINYINNEGDSVGMLIQSQSIQDTAGLTWDQRLALDNFLIKNLNGYPVTLNISGKIEFICTGMVSSPPYNFRVRFNTSNQTIPNQNDYEYFDAGVLTVGQKYTHEYAVTVTLAPNEKLFAEGIFYGLASGTDASIEFTENSKLKVEFISRYGTTYINAHRAQYLFTKLIDRLSEGTYTAAIASYFNQYRQVVFTSGNGIRGLDEAVIKLSWNDFFQFWDCFDSVGIIDKKPVIDFAAKENLVDEDNFIDLPTPGIDSFRVSIDKSYLFNELEIGYPEIKNDVGVLNGNEEFNSKVLFSLGATKSPARLDKVSKVKASCYEIEKIRVTTLEKTTTDFKADNDTYALHIEDDLQPAAGDVPDHYRLDRTLNASATGLLEPQTVFNVFLSPKRMLLRQGSFLRSSMYLADNMTLSWKTSDKNNALVAGGIVEKADVNMGSLQPKFFVPVLFDGDFPAPEDLIELLDLNPLQVFRFPFDGEYYKGILVKTSIAPSSRKSQNYQLLSTAGNPLHKLIDYYG